MEKFNVEHQYILFLERIGLHEDRMHPQQKKQIKETFFGTFGQVLILLRDDLSELPEDQGVEKMQSMLDQVGDFFLGQAKRSN